MRAPTTAPARSIRGPCRSARGLIALAGLFITVLGGAALADDTAPPPPPQLDYGIRPGFYEDTILPGDNYTFAMEPGTSIDDTVVIFNYLYEPQQYHVYGADLIQALGGGFSPAARDAEHQGSGAWIVPGQTTVEVPPRSYLEVPFTVTIPEHAVPGDHPGTIVVERRIDTNRQGVSVQPRLALRVRISVPGEINLGVNLGALTADQADGTVRFQVPIGNTGNVTFTTAGIVAVTGHGDPIELALRPDGLYAVPGGEATLWSVWEHPPWFGRVQAQADIDVTVGNHDPVRYTTEPITVWFIPWLVIGLATSVVALTAGILLATRRQREQRRRRRQRERALRRRVRETLDKKPGADLTDDEVVRLAEEIDLTEQERA